MSLQLKADNSLPRNGVIAFYSALTVVVLFGLKFVFDSYFHMMIDNVRAERAAIAALPACTAQSAASDVGVTCRRSSSPLDELQRLRERERSMLAGGNGAMPMANAVLQLTNGREIPAISPQQSTEMAPIKGWVNLPHFVSTARPNMDTTATAAPSAPVTEPVMDPAAVPAAATAAEPATHAEGHATP